MWTQELAPAWKGPLWGFFLVGTEAPDTLTKESLNGCRGTLSLPGWNGWGLPDPMLSHPESLGA